MRYVVLITFYLILTACGGSVLPREAALRAWVNEMESAAEEQNRAAILDKISERYVDARGNSRQDIGEQLRLYFFRQRNLSFVTRIESLKFSDKSAADMRVTLAVAGTNAGLAGFNANGYRINLELEKVDARWLLIGAQWGRLSGRIF